MSELIDLAEWCEQLREANAFNECISFFSKGDECRHVDYFITAHLSKSKQQVAEHHIKHFRNVLDRKTCGRGRRLYKAVFVEEGKEETIVLNYQTLDEEVVDYNKRFQTGTMVGFSLFFTMILLMSWGLA